MLHNFASSGKKRPCLASIIQSESDLTPQLKIDNPQTGLRLVNLWFYRRHYEFTVIITFIEYSYETRRTRRQKSYGEGIF